jgi:chorismate dehydratase
LIRIGAVPYLNGKPLVGRLDGEPNVEVVYDVPSNLAAMLESGEIAAGLVSSVACFTNPSLQIVSGISISCDGPAESVKLFHKGRLRDIRSVALDTSSLTSVLLAKIILRERHELLPDFVPMPPSLPEMLETCEAAVTIGDTTMCAPADRWLSIDLGEEWRALTGLPFVFAVWAVNPELATPELVDILARAKARGLGSLREISEEEAARLDLPFEVCFHYLSRTMDYDLTERHMEGLRLFREKIARYGLMPSAHEPQLYQPSSAKSCCP